MAKLDEGVGKICNDTFRPAVGVRRNPFEKWRNLGISSVPSVIINDKYLVSGGQPPEVFEQALRQVAAGG